jgi:uncharacterized protein
MMTASTITDQIAYLQQKWYDHPPFAKLFQTEFGNYLYDPGTNKLLKCSDVTFAALHEFQSNDVHSALKRLLVFFNEHLVSEALRDIIDAIITENVLLTNPDDIYFDSRHFSNLESELNENLGILILEVTENCNLRCAYCVYNDVVKYSRNHGTKHMSLSTAFKAIDYLSTHSSRQPVPAVTFYGGEPLTRFSFIATCVKYSHEVFKKRPLSFSVTTNGTTVNAEIASFFATENVNVMVSIDGPKDIHDEYRVYRNGKGSFEAAMRGLRYLIEAYGENAEDKIMLSMVYTPPFSSKRLEKITSLWKEYPWMGNIQPTISYPQFETIPIEKVGKREELIEDEPLGKWAIESYASKYKEQGAFDVLVKNTVDKALLRIMRRPIFNEPQNAIHLNGCCIPGARKIYVNTEGYIAVCERVHNVLPYIGHIESGVDYDLVKTLFVDGYALNSIAQCSRCWAQRLCGVCYTDGLSEGAEDQKRKAIDCEGVRSSTEEHLKAYSRLLHINPKGLNYLAEMKVS